MSLFRALEIITLFNGNKIHAVGNETVQKMLGKLKLQL